MTYTPRPVIVAAGLAASLLFGLSSAHAAAKPRAALSCAPAATAAIPPDYLYYHGLVAAHPLLRPEPKEKPGLLASCTQRKVIRT